MRQVAGRYRPLDPAERAGSASLSALIVALAIVVLTFEVAPELARPVLPALKTFAIALPAPLPEPPAPKAAEAAGGSITQPVPRPAPAPALPRPVLNPAPAPAPSAPVFTPALVQPTPAPAPATTEGSGTGGSGAGGTGGAGSGTGEGTSTGPGHGIGDPSSAIAAEWVKEASWQEIYEYHPERAKRVRQSGHAMLVCQVTLKRRLVNCAVREESPGGWQFGEAALRLTRELRVYPRKIDGQPINLGWVRFTINFVFPRVVQEPKRTIG
ncbi:MAG: energy transducer TonB [Novosphingobium sp.]|nr:energy transducer TonB [Novosphingobium sp.]